MNPTLDELRSRIAEIGNDELRLTALDALSVPNFGHAPASLGFHHAYEGGLAIHTLEFAVAHALDAAGIRYATQDEVAKPLRLDFKLIDLDHYIEVKSGHSPRISDQMSRHQNVIALQGVKSVSLFCKLLEGRKLLMRCQDYVEAVSHKTMGEEYRSPLLDDINKALEL